MVHLTVIVWVGVCLGGRGRLGRNRAALDSVGQKRDWPEDIIGSLNASGLLAAVKTAVLYEFTSGALARLL